MSLSTMGTVSEVCTDFTEHTTILGLYFNFIAKYKRTTIKVLWLCFIIGLFVGYGWYCYSCVMKYLNYPVAVQTTVPYLCKVHIQNFLFYFRLEWTSIVDISCCNIL